jgi:hypothetical protein
MTRTSTYTALFALVVGHLLANYLAVRSVVLQSLNRQRSSILWRTFPNSTDGNRTVTLAPTEVSNRGIILVIPGRLRDAVSNRIIGQGSLGTSVQHAMTHCNAVHVLKMLFQNEPYVLFVTDRRPCGQQGPSILVSFKDGYDFLDRLCAWLHALEIAATWNARATSPTVSETEDIVLSTRDTIRKHFSRFMEYLEGAG